MQPTSLCLDPSLGFSRQEYWSGLPFPSPGNLPDLGSNQLLLYWLLLLLLSHFSRVRRFATPWTAAYQAPPSMGFSRQEYWSGVPLPSPPVLAGRFFTISTTWEAQGLDVTERLHLHVHVLEKKMATHSSVLAWRIPGTGEPGGLPSVGRTESDTTEAIKL